MDQSQSMEDDVLNWLRVRGYPLEMKVAQQFRRESRHFPFVGQGWNYVDPVTRQVRSTDVVAATGVHNYRHIREIDIMIVMECKDRTAPWIVLKDEQNIYDLEYEPHIVLSSLLPNTVPEKVVGEIFPEEVMDYYDDGTLLLSVNPGYEICEKRNTEKSKIDYAYASTQQVVSASLADVIPTFMRDENQTSLPPKVVFPTVVTTAPLYEVWLDSSADLKIAQVERSSIVTRISSSSPDVMVNVVTFAALGNFIAACDSTAHMLQTANYQKTILPESGH
ncbi:hypothetical protein SAMN04489713_102160 [Actinomadura madurae]|uniref:Uncharacterized protein n=2 Tax=Actinomadura madurae TaxID=1993 RepID=A0A1I4ZD86_9ACTN|nr:hypothetical protein SAMN04489713_102160 [Actinomadura madurae]